MTDAVEVSVNKMLIDRLLAFTQSPDIRVSVPNISFPPPAAGQDVWYLRATFLPAESFALGIGYSAVNQHYGLLQVDVFYGENSGEYAAGRVATDVISWFKRGTKLGPLNGFRTEVFKTPWRSRMIKDSPWVIIPVNVPYIAFANPA